MTDPLDKALRVLRSTIMEMDQLARALERKPLGFDRKRLPPGPRAGSAAQAIDVSGLPPTLSPRQVKEGWDRGGASWLAALGRRDLSSVAAATGDGHVGPALVAAPGFVASLLPLVRERRRPDLLARMYFHHYPPPEHVLIAFLALRSKTAPEEWPKWWSAASASHEALANKMASRLVEVGWEPLADELDLPEQACAGTWAVAVAKRARPQTVPAARHLLQFGDGGCEMQSRSPLRPATVEAVRAIVACGERVAATRLTLASLLRHRVGDVFGWVDEFGPVDEASWRDLPEERKKVRSWVASEVLDVLFKHLVPNTEFAHQTEPRRRFWASYTPVVERLWVLVERRLRKRLEGSELRPTLDRLRDVIEIHELEGGEEQAVVWMHLRDRAALVTVIEGNANASCRMRAGLFPPPDRLVRYSADIVQGKFCDAARDVVVVRHQGAWQNKLGAELAKLGVRRW